MEHGKTLSDNRYERLLSDATSLRNELRDAKMELNSNHLDISEYKMTIDALKEENEGLKDQLERSLSLQKDNQTAHTKLKTDLLTTEAKLAESEVDKAQVNAILQERTSELASTSTRHAQALGR